MVSSKKEWISALSQELERIMDFWSVEMIDKENGGFYGAMDHFGKIKADATKGAVLNARILWAFSATFRFGKKARNQEMARRAYTYFMEHFRDREHGGVYWELDARGRPLNTRKQAYAQGFAVYGLAEYYRALGDEEALEAAFALFHDIETHFYDQEHGGYIEALAADRSALDDMRLSAKDANEPKSMNTHLHLLEPYTNLYRCRKDPQLAEAIRRLIRVFLDHIIDAKTAHFQLFFEMDWKVKSDIVSYGHDIEGSWLLAEAAEVLGDRALIDEVNAMALRMCEVTLAEGTDRREAGQLSLFNEREGEALDSDKHWWPQAEAMVGWVNAWQLSGKESYLEAAQEVWTFIQKKLIDQQNGEWYWRVDAAGKPCEEEEKAGFWKCPYHNSRALIEVLERTEDNGEW
ncbi:AGE family epimerase/isomerase [Roseimarinus sediminis]|uniref:AGE family epimerase/isomerase n=1 Tax=Roseimarinus sediminis TaxID=1610899 RepID=UPI003D233747